jgi:S-adenosylmethionine hydrolase
MSSRVIALLTDFGHRDPFVGIMKGVILGINPDVHLIDISHEIAPQHIREAAIVLEASYVYFPPQTIFLAVVDPGVGGGRRSIVVETPDYHFVAPDNGILGPVLDRTEVRRVVHATEERYLRRPVSRTFHGRDVFAPLTAWLARGTQASEMGASIDDYQRLQFPQPHVLAGEALVGEVIYRDRFGNLITNMAEDWVRASWGPPPWRDVEAHIGTSIIHGLDSHYAQRSPCMLGLIINSWGRFEIFANEGSAAELTGGVEGSPVRLDHGKS